MTFDRVANCLGTRAAARYLKSAWRLSLERADALEALLDLDAQTAAAAWAMPRSRPRNMWPLRFQRASSISKQRQTGCSRSPGRRQARNTEATVAGTRCRCIPLGCKVHQATCA